MSKPRKKFDTKNESMDNVQNIGSRKKFHVHDLKSLKPLNPRQEQFFEEYSKGTELISLLGFPGTGKSMCAMYAALHDVFSEDTPYDKVIIVRSNVTCGDDPGHLPGPQPYSAKVLTPSGWRLMGSLEKGDEVMSADGSRVKILDIFEKGEKDVYEIKTTRGNKTTACDDHLWLTQTQEERKRDKSGKIRTTREIKETLLGERYTKKGKVSVENHILPVNSAMQFVEESSVKFSPYLLGYMLGDGNFQGCPSLVVHEQDVDQLRTKVIHEMNKYPFNGITVKVNKMNTVEDNMYSLVFSGDRERVNKRGFQVDVKHENGDHHVYNNTKDASSELGIKRWKVQDCCMAKKSFNGMSFSYKSPDVGDMFTNPIKNVFHELGILDKTLNDKFIPDDYLYKTTVDERLELLRGLMDSDGACTKNGEAVFYNCSKLLVDGVRELVQSLGGKTGLRVRKSRPHSSYKGCLIESKKLAYEVSVSLPEEMNPFFYTRKSERFVCKLTHMDRISSVERVGREKVRCILIDHPDHLYVTDDYIVTHNTIDEKFEPYEAPYRSIAKQLIKYNDPYSHLKSLGYLQFQPTTFLRGMTFDNAIIIVEECQNYEYELLYTCLSRVGHNSRIILTGDARQDDLKNKRKQSGLAKLLRVLQRMPYQSSCEIDFKLEDIVRSQLAKEFIIAAFQEDDD